MLYKLKYNIYFIIIIICSLLKTRHGILQQMRKNYRKRRTIVTKGTVIERIISFAIYEFLIDMNYKILSGKFRSFQKVY